MELNVKEFYWAVNHVSVGSVFDYIQMLISPTKVKSSLSTNTRSLTTILNFENKFLNGIRDNEIIELNFHQPNIEVLPHLKLFDSEVLSCELTKGKMHQVIKMNVKEAGSKKSANWNLAEAIPTKIHNNPQLANNQYFAEVNVDEEFSKQIQALRKIAFNTGKIYFTTNKKVLSIETGDRSQKFINTFQIELQEFDIPNGELSTNYDNIAICLDAQIFMSIMNQLDIEKEFKCKLAYKVSKRIGMLCVVDKDATETYLMPQIIENS